MGVSSIGFCLGRNRDSFAFEAANKRTFAFALILTPIGELVVLGGFVIEVADPVESRTWDRLGVKQVKSDRTLLVGVRGKFFSSSVGGNVGVMMRGLRSFLSFLVVRSTWNMNLVF